MYIGLFSSAYPLYAWFAFISKFDDDEHFRRDMNTELSQMAIPHHAMVPADDASLLCGRITLII